MREHAVWRRLRIENSCELPSYTELYRIYHKSKGANSLLDSAWRRSIFRNILLRLDKHKISDYSVSCMVCTNAGILIIRCVADTLNHSVIESLFYIDWPHED
jgi:hypothetical protein